MVVGVGEVVGWISGTVLRPLCSEPMRIAGSLQRLIGLLCVVLHGLVVQQTVLAGEC